jgi:16S rRNA (adenine1518-N6/adenine1519-N6)-dimethyltransferase
MSTEHGCSAGETPVAGHASAQPSLRRLRQFGIRPNRELGQNFLVDSNLLSVIAGAAELDARDTALEIGGGVGILSEYLAARVAHLHVIELDRQLEGALRDATGRFANVSVHWGDALRIDLAALTPKPQKVVANLPYGVASAVIVRTIDELPEVDRWVVMVQREVGERMAAAPGGRAYGASSVVIQLACDVKLLRAIPRTVFHPVPKVDSVLVELRRRAVGGEPVTARVDPALRALVYDAFAHRRKTLAGSLALARRTRSHAPPSREHVREALTELGHPPDARAERLTPQDFVALADMLAR